MFHDIFARLSDMGFAGISVFVIEVALLILLIGKLIQFIQFALKKK